MNDVLIDIVEEILPNGELGWEAVAIAYQAKTNEESLRDMTDVKKHWLKNLCNSMKKPTDRSGKNGDRICRCIAIKKNIMRKTHSGFLGVLSDEDDVANNVLLGSADEGGLDDEIDDDAVETRSVLNTSTESDTVDNNGEPDDGKHPVDNLPPLVQRDVAGNSNECNEGTPRPRGGVNISVALRRASSTARAEKNKNSSNKNKECTSIAGAIVKLLERQQPSSTNECDERSAMFTMTIMWQM
jgi:hypothetical protein